MSHEWNALVSWVSATEGGYVSPLIQYRDIPNAGRGLVVTEMVNPGTILAIIPQKCMMNSQTIRSLYPPGIIPRITWKNGLGESALNTTQALTMHIYQWRKGLYSSDTLTPYLRSLPTSFKDHPLNWAVMGNPHFKVLLSLTPPSTQRALTDVERRFRKDYKAVSPVVSTVPSTGSPLPMDLEDFIWAWLIVNTRCIHYSMSPSLPQRHIEDYDLTLAPIIDFANHTSEESLSTTLKRDAQTGALHFLSTPNKELQPGDEVFLRYGFHSNATLFSEYGFVLPYNADDEGDGGEVSIDDLVEKFILGKCKGPWLKETLEIFDYWGSWTLHSHPGPPYPTYRLIPALRLAQLSLPKDLPDPILFFEQDEPQTNEESASEDLNGWRASVMGFQDLVSPENEALVRKSLRRICQDLITRSASGLELVRTGQDKARVDGEYKQPWVAYAWRCLECLWEEESAIAKGVMGTVEQGIQF